MRESCWWLTHSVSTLASNLAQKEWIGAEATVFLVSAVLGFYFGLEKKKIPPPASSKLSECPLAWILSSLLRVGKHLVQSRTSSLDWFRKNLPSTYQNRFAKGINMEDLYAAGPDQNVHGDVVFITQVHAWLALLGVLICSILSDTALLWKLPFGYFPIFITSLNERNRKHLESSIYPTKQSHFWVGLCSWSSQTDYWQWDQSQSSEEAVAKSSRISSVGSKQAATPSALPCPFSWDRWEGSMFLSHSTDQRVYAEFMTTRKRPKITRA